MAANIETKIKEALADLTANSDMRGQLKELTIANAKELNIGSGNILLIYVRVPLMKVLQKIQVRLTREFEKKFNGRHVVFVAQRRVLPQPKRGGKRRLEKQKRPRSRTLTSVHEALLEDIVFPAEVVGKRVRIKQDGKKLIKVHLDKTQQINCEHKIDTFSSIYKHLTGKDAHFEFVEQVC